MPAPAPAAPTNLRELFAHLHAQPRVICRHPNGNCLSGPRRFTRVAAGGLWFVADDGRESYLPINCGQVDSETGIDFQPHGFGVTKFNTRVFYEYANGDQP